MPLIQDLITTHILRTEEIMQAFQAVPRELFLPPDIQPLAEENRPLPIGHGQTNSQPLTVAFMLELLQPQAGEQILDIGFGSGWTTALLAQIAGEQGRVTAIEIVPELFEQGRANVERAGFTTNVDFKQGSWEEYFKPDQEPSQAECYDVILVSATAEAVPARLRMALKEDGRLVMPIAEGSIGDHVIVKIVRTGQDFIREEYPGFQFVPLI